MKTRQSGFTLIELVMVITIIGVLAAIAVPKFIDLSGDANQAAVDGVAGALSSASATNYAARKANSGNGLAVATCGAVAALLQGGALPSGFSVTAGTSATAVAANASVTSCAVQKDGSSPLKTATFTAIGIS